MKCDDLTDLLSDRLQGLNSPEDERRLDAHLESCAACREEAAAVAMLWAELGEVSDAVPHERLRARFHAALAAYEQRASRSGLERLLEHIRFERPAFALAAAMALVVAGFLAGRATPSDEREDEIAQLRRELGTVSLALLDHQSASERLLGVEWSRRTGTASSVTAALLDVALNDRNVNVRLAALDALDDWLDRPEVGAALTAALDRENDPLMQVTLAGVLLESRVTGSVATVERLAARDGLEPAVRDYLAVALQRAAGEPPAGGDLL